jgi:hypothetical protein
VPCLPVPLLHSYDHRLAPHAYEAKSRLLRYNTLGRPSCFADEIDPGSPTRSDPGGVEFQQRARVELLAVLFWWKEGVGDLLSVPYAKELEWVL